MTERKIPGGCHCGAVRYELAQAPTYSMVCHCKTCRGISGAPVLAWVTLRQDDFAVRTGSPQSYSSSTGIVRQFCSKCGAQLTYQTDEDPEWIDVTTASLDDPSAFPPSHHSWSSDDISWVKFGDGLPTFQQSRNDV